MIIYPLTLRLNGRVRTFSVPEPLSQYGLVEECMDKEDEDWKARHKDELSEVDIDYLTSLEHYGA